MLFKKKTPIEEFSAQVIREGLPRALAFYEQENKRSHVRLMFSEEELPLIGAGTVIFYFSSRFSSDSSADKDKVHRAIKGVRRTISKMGYSSDRAQDWWKAIEGDALIVGSSSDPLELSCKAVWNRTHQDRPFNEHGALRSFLYFLQVEVDAMDKLKIV